MDELELLRRSVAEPGSHDPDYRKALAANPAAQRSAAATHRFDQAVHAELMHPPLPEGMNARILLRTDMRQRRSRQRWFGGLALAASVLIAVSVTLRPDPVADAQRSFGQMALDHVHAEISHLDHLPNSTVAASTLSTLVRELGADLVGTIEAVRFAYICPTPQGPGLHMITDGPGGPVTVLYVPGATPSSSEEEFADERFVGLASAMAGGSLAVIGESMTDIQSVRARLAAQIRSPEELAKLQLSI